MNDGRSIGHEGLLLIVIMMNELIWLLLLMRSRLGVTGVRIMKLS